MDRYERINLLHRSLRLARYPVPAQRLMDELQCSRATVYRDVAFLRDVLGAPVETSEEPAGFRYDAAEAERFELPGLWLSPDELHALLATRQLLAKSGPGDFLAEALEPVRGRIEALLSEQPAANTGRSNVSASSPAAPAASMRPPFAWSPGPSCSGDGWAFVTAPVPPVPRPGALSPRNG